MVLVSATNSSDYKIFFVVSLHFAYSSGINIAENTYDLIFYNEAAVDLAVKQILSLRQF